MTIEYFFILSSRGFYSHRVRRIVHCLCITAGVHPRAHHSAVAIHKLACMTEYNGAASIFIKTLLDKKYSLPVPVIQSIIGHFVRFQDKPGVELPVLWHQALLVFVQRYKNEVGVAGGEGTVA